MDFNTLFLLIKEYPILIIAIILVVAVVFINGWTDAPNAIATCVSTKAIKPKFAVLMAAIFNCLGVISMFFLSKATSETIANMVDFGDHYETAVYALSAGMIGVVVWGILAWSIGIPSSESHALIAGITGAGLAAMTLGISGVKIHFGPTSSWAFTLYGLILSCVFGFVIGYLVTRLIQLICYKMNRNKTRPFFKVAQIFSGAAMAYVHGAQDGLKFLGVLLLAINLAYNAKFGVSESSFVISNSEWYIALIIALIMGLGTSLGGYRIIKKVGMGMVSLETYEGFATDITSAIGIFLSTFFGIPVSTTQVKSFAILGVGATKGVKHIKWSVVKEMLLTWVFTFPGCGIIGYVFALIFIKIFGG